MRIKHFLFFTVFVMSYGFLNAPRLEAQMAAQTQMLDQAVLNAAVRISRGLPSGTVVAIVNFSSASLELNNYVANELHGAIFRQRRIAPITLSPSQLQSVGRNLRLDESDEITDESAQVIGGLLEAEQLVTGKLERVGLEYRLVFTVVDTGNPSHRHHYSIPVDLQNDSRLTPPFRRHQQPAFRHREQAA